MKKNRLTSFAGTLAVCILFFTSCQKDKCTQTMSYKKYSPVYMTYDDLRQAVKTEAAQPLKKPGKIYIKGHYLFINEVDKGIHIFDNSNPAAPQNLSFINIPGNLDLAAMGDVLYADSYIDLLALDISNPLSVTVLSRTENALPYRQYAAFGYSEDKTKGVVVAWKDSLITEKVNTDCKGGGGWWGGGPDPWFDNAGGPVTTNSGTTTNPKTPGVGGSTARFTIAFNTLYIVDDTKLLVYDITNESNPQKMTDKTLGWNIETIFPYKKHLFIGSNSAVYIYNINNPQNPVYVSEYQHMTACDPVVVDDEYAYFTLNDGAPCNRGVNELQILDITDLAHPFLKTSVPLTSPKGLGIDNKKLFVCDGNDGLKVYDATDVTQIQNRRISHFQNIHAADVIPFNSILLMIGEDGLCQYDYSDIQNISLLSRIAVE